jgi:phenylpropionate dioxygenase-like ring-hydroxylating dioxygenase large terminal subunit
MTAQPSPSLPVPRGWFRVGFADDSPPGTVRPLRYFGRDLVLVVTESGTPRLFDAFCPHLGAHLGHGGRVEGETLRCPFHGWQFGVDGRCREIPYASRIPPRASLRAWPTIARNGIIFAWHGSAGSAPDYEIPEVPEIGSPDWTRFVHRRWTVRSRCQEIAENTADPAHFGVVHGMQRLTPELSFDGPHFRSFSSYEVSRRGGETLDSTLEVTWYGLGLGVTRVTGLLELLFLGTLTPIDEEEVEVDFSFSVCSARGLTTDSGAGKASIDESVRQMEQDIPIWESKRYLEQPLLCDGDGPIGRFRSWSAQFHA